MDYFCLHLFFFSCSSRRGSLQANSGWILGEDSGCITSRQIPGSQMLSSNESSKLMKWASGLLCVARKATEPSQCTGWREAGKPPFFCAHVMQCVWHTFCTWLLPTSRRNVDLEFSNNHQNKSKQQRNKNQNSHGMCLIEMQYILNLRISGTVHNAVANDVVWYEWYSAQMSHYWMKSKTYPHLLAFHCLDLAGFSCFQNRTEVLQLCH